VSVGVQSYSYGCVSKELLYELGVNVTAQEQGGTGVPEVVEAYLGQSGLLEKRFEGPFYEVFGVTGVPTLVEKIRPWSS
jgi:hypothetical protein